MCKHDLPTQHYKFNSVYSTSTQTSHAWCMQAAFHILSSKPLIHNTCHTHLLPIPSKLLSFPNQNISSFRVVLCNHQPHCWVICEVKTNDNDQTKETQGRASGSHLPSWNVRMARRETQAPVRGWRRRLKRRANRFHLSQSQSVTLRSRWRLKMFHSCRCQLIVIILQLYESISEIKT